MVYRVWDIVPLKKIGYRVYGDLIIIYPKPYSIYLRGTRLSWMAQQQCGA